MITYTYKVLSLRKTDVTYKPSPDPAKEYKNFIVGATIKISGTKDSKTIDIERSCSFNIPEVEPSPFIEYDKIDESDVIIWFCNNTENLEAKSTIKKQFELEAGTKVDNNFPWEE